MNQPQTLLQAQARRGLPLTDNLAQGSPTLGTAQAWRFGVEIKGIMFTRVQRPGEDIRELREQHPGVFILSIEDHVRDYGDAGRERLAENLERHGIRFNRFEDDGELLVPHPNRHPDDEELEPLSQARAFGVPNVEYRRWTMKENPSVGINHEDILANPQIRDYHAFSFELVSPILPNDQQGFQELTRVVNILYSYQVYFNSTGGVDVHVGLDYYMIPLRSVKQIAAVLFAADFVITRYHKAVGQDNTSRPLIRTTSNLAHGLTARQAQTRSLAQLDGTVDWERRNPPPFDIDYGRQQITEANSYGTLYKLLSIERGATKANHGFPLYDVSRNPTNRPETTIEFRQYSANMDYAEDLAAWVKVCLRLCSFACQIDDAEYGLFMLWCDRYEREQLPREENWRSFFRMLGGLDDVLAWYDEGTPLVGGNGNNNGGPANPGHQTAAERRAAYEYRTPPDQAYDTPEYPQNIRDPPPPPGNTPEMAGPANPPNPAPGNAPVQPQPLQNIPAMGPANPPYPVAGPPLIQPQPIRPSNSFGTGSGGPPYPTSGSNNASLPPRPQNIPGMRPEGPPYPVTSASSSSSEEEFPPRRPIDYNIWRPISRRNMGRNRRSRRSPQTNRQAGQDPNLTLGREAALRRQQQQQQTPQMGDGGSSSSSGSSGSSDRQRGQPFILHPSAQLPMADALLQEEPPRYRSGFSPDGPVVLVGAPADAPTFPYVGGLPGGAPFNQRWQTHTGEDLGSPPNRMGVMDYTY